MSNTALGAALTIDDSVLAKITEAENRIIRLEQTTRTSADKIAKSFRSAGDVGIQYFIKKLKLAQTELNNINMPKMDFGKNVNFGQVGQQATELANSVTKVSVAINKMADTDKNLSVAKSVKEWQELQKNITDLEKRQESLIRITREYENTLTRIQSGKGGMLTTNMQEQYKAAQLELATNKQLIESYRQKQQAIVSYQAEQRKQIENAQALRNFESQQSSLPEQRKAEELKKMNEYYRGLEKISKRQAEQAAKDAEKEAAARKKAEEATRRQMEAENRRRANNIDKQNTAALTAYNRAMAASEGTITQRINKIAKLKQAEEQLSRAQRNSSQEITKIKAEIERLTKANEAQAASYSKVQKSQSGLINTSDQLARKLALIFSVSQIQGYVNKLIQVRGEFELQNTALASILQNKDQADKLFGQITELAIRSPFTVKELTTYTKSLAAYQFQYEELYDTTKRLADVASGLGVDMQRLILAVGQVKAAGYLRGTETRQFTEAGFNILGELAKYYSELEGRIVSVGEVQERQFKRMIAFQDVEEVFRRVTDAGGMFYQMQEKQAETLAGQMSNLKDSIDLMFNSIGEQNDGTLKDMVALVRSFIENWQEVVFVLKPAVTALGAWKTLTLLASIGNKQFALSLYAIATNAKTATASISLMTRATTALAAVGRGLMSVFAIAIPVALIAGVIELYRVTTKASREVNELKKALDGISNEGFVRASELISNFKVLAEKAVEAADGSKEQQEALEELERTYKDILPEEQLKIESLRELKGEYDNVTTAIYSKIEAQIKEKQIQEVSNTYGTAASEAMDALAKRLTDYNISLSTAKTITNEFKKMLEQGMIKDANQAKTELENLIRLFSGQYASLGEQNIWQKLGWTTGVDVIDEIDDAFNAFTRFNDEVKRLEGEPITPFRIGGGTEVYQSLKEELENIAKFKDDWEKQNKDKFKFKVEFNEESKNALISQYQKFIADLNSKISSGQIKQGDILSANLIIEEAQKAIEKLDVSPQIAQVNDLRVEFSKLYGIDFEKFNFTKMLEGQGFNDFIKRLDEGIQGYKEIIEVFDEAARQGTEVPAMQQWALLQGKTIEEIRTLVPVLEEYRAKLALVTKEEDKKRGRDNTEQIFKQRLEFFERANKEYEKLLKNYSEEEARAKVVASMMDEAQQRGVGGIFMSAEFDEKGTLDSLSRVKAMYKSLSEDMRIEFAKAFGGIQLDMDVEIRQDRIKTIQNQFSELFGSYELSLELDKLGLDKNLMSQLFGVEVFDLSQLRKVLEPFKSELQNVLGKEGVSAWDEMNKKISQAEQKELQDRLKTYSQYLKKSVSERVAIEMEAQKKIAEVRATKEFSPEQQGRIVTQIKQETQVKKDEQAWKEFQNSELYIKMFEDLEFASTKALDVMEQKLIEVRSSLKNLSPTELKQINEQLEKIRDIRMSRNPFEGLQDNIKGYIAYLKVANELNQKFIDSQNKQDELSSLYDNQSRLRNELEAQYAIEVKLNGENSARAIQLKQQIKQQDKILDVTLKQLVAQGKITQEIANQIREGETNASSLSGQFEVFAQLATEIGSSISTIASSLENVFGSMSNGMSDAVDSFTEIINGLGQTAQGVAELIATQGTSPTAWIKTITGLASTIGSIFAIGDKKKEREIQRQIEQVEKLEKAYEKLEKAIDSAYSIDTLEKSTDQAIANLEEKNRRYQEMIAAEKDKKKTDDDRIKEWEEAIIANNEEIAALLEESVSIATSGIFDELLSAANEFTDAWLESFKEIGNGMDGLEQSFQEMLTNMVKQQATMLITNTFLDNWKKQLEQYVNADDLRLTSEEAKKWVDAVKEDLPALNEALENYFKAMGEAGLDLSGEGGDTMSTLQKGIQGVTEETAQALEALLNSMRYFVSDSNLQLRTILATLTAPAPENPFLLELKAQTEQLRTMNSLWNSLSKMSTGNGRVLKVQIV